jgi:ubiquinol oxidase
MRIMKPHKPFRHLQPTIKSVPKHKPKDLRDRFARLIVTLMRIPADVIFAKRYGHRAVVLETVAAVPGMVGGLLQHLKALRLIRDDHGWIHTLLDEAENERMHLMAFVEIARPSWLEGFLILLVQFCFSTVYFFIYVLSPKTAHRIVGYLEEEAVISYTEYLAEIDAGRTANIHAPHMAIEYWGLDKDARLRDLVVAVRKDEENHRDVNHTFANSLSKK